MSRQKWNQKARENGAVGDRDGEKKRTAWKGGKQFHANKGWTIGELSGSPPPSVALPLSPSQSQGRAFSTGIKQGEGLVFFLSTIECSLKHSQKVDPIQRKGFLFLWCSSIIHRPFYGLVSALEGLPKPGCIWIISLWYSPSRALHPQCSGYWRWIKKNRV